MPSLFFTCPNTRQQADTGIMTDAESLRDTWSMTLNVNCPHCGEVRYGARQEQSEARPLARRAREWRRRCRRRGGREGVDGPDPIDGPFRPEK